MIGPLLRQEIESLFRVIPERCSTDELVFICPECGDKSGNRSVNLKTGRTFCWRCNKGNNNKGNFLAWARALGYSLSNTASNVGVDVGSLLYETTEQISAVPVIQSVELPRSFTPIARTPKSIYTQLITEMAVRKNLIYDDFVEAGVGYAPDDSFWEPYAIFPVYEHRLCAYYQGRTYVDVPGETTKKFPSRKEVKYGASYWVYNIDEARQPEMHTVIAVESILNVLSLRWKMRELGWKGIVPVCVFKHYISVVQSLKLLRCKNIKEICLLFDRDALDRMWQGVAMLSNKIKVSVAEMPYRSDNKKLDPNDDVEAAIVAIEKRKGYSTSTSFQHLLDSAGKPAATLAGRKFSS